MPYIPLSSPLPPFLLLQLIIARDIAKAPELTNLLKQCATTVLGSGKVFGALGRIAMCDDESGINERGRQTTHYLHFLSHTSGGAMRGVENHGVRALSHRLRK